MLPEDLESTPFPIIDTHAHYDDAAGLEGFITTKFGVGYMIG